MDVKDNLMKCTVDDLDVAPETGLYTEPDEFDVDPYKVSELLCPICRVLAHAAAFITYHHGPPSHTGILIVMQRT